MTARLSRTVGETVTAPVVPAVCTRTRVHVTEAEAQVLQLIMAEHASALGRDLNRSLSGMKWAERKKLLTAEGFSSRAAGAVTSASNKQHSLSERAQFRDLVQTRRTVNALQKRLALSVGETQYVTRKGEQVKAKLQPYASQGIHWYKQQRLQILLAKIARLERDRSARKLHVVRSGKARLKKRHRAENVDEWRAGWEAARSPVHSMGDSTKANGSDTIRVTPDGTVLIHLPVKLQHLANAPHGRYRVAMPVSFATNHGAEWQARAAAHRSLQYRLWHCPVKGKWYLDASWSRRDDELPKLPEGSVGRVYSLDTNHGFLSGIELDTSGNPVGAARDYLTFSVLDDMPASQRDACVRHQITAVIHCMQSRGLDTLVMEDLGFIVSREDSRGKRFRKIVNGLGATLLRQRLIMMMQRAGIRVILVDPAFTSQWGAQHWLAPIKVSKQGSSKHHAATIVIGRRGQGYRACRKQGTTIPDQRIEAGMGAHAVPVPGMESGQLDGMTAPIASKKDIQAPVKAHEQGQPASQTRSGKADRSVVLLDSQNRSG
jgi:IS605 OrfB family transposase